VLLDVYESIVALSTGPNSGSARFTLAVEHDGPFFFLTAGGNDADSGNFTRVQSSNLFRAETLLHVAATIDFAANAIELFVNGESIPLASPQANFLTSNETSPDTPSAGAFLGAYGDGSTHLLSATIDDVRIYNTVLSHEEIAALAVPEPSSMVLLSGICLFAGSSRRRVRSR
jgi:hypothetical protein